MMFSFTLSNAKYKDKRNSTEERVQDLLSKMTLEEKIAQMSNFGGHIFPIVNNEITSDTLENAFRGLSYGAVNESLSNVSAEDMAIRLYYIQDYFLNKTRLGIPCFPTSVAKHGLIADGATIFPQLISMGSTWNKQLMVEVGEAIAKEVSVLGYIQDIGPNVDCAVDARWGRFEECFGQDPYHVSEMAVSYIYGMQGDIRNGSIERGKVFSTIKHFAGYSKPINGINIGPTSIGEREFRDIFLYPFKEVIDRVGQWSVMPSYHAVNNQPCHGSANLLQNRLREEMGFKGYVYSDWGGVEMLHYLHNVAPSYVHAAARAIKAGVDMNAPATGAFVNIPEALSKKLIKMSDIDSAVANVLRVKFMAGLFDRKLEKPKLNKIRSVLHKDSHIAIARKVAQESCVLLQNKDQILPLKLDKVKKMAIIGPNSAQLQFGDYTYSHESKYGMTILQGLNEALEDSVKLIHAQGCKISDLSKDGFVEARQIANESDVVVLVCGGSSRQFGGVGWLTEGVPGDEAVTCGEGYDIDQINLPGVQEDLIKEVASTGKKVILILLNGRPYDLTRVLPYTSAVLEAWYPGEEGGRVVADILMGKVNPSGRLAIDWVRNSGQAYSHYNYLPCSRGFYQSYGTPEKPGRDYVFSSPLPLFPFGYGLSYSSFDYANLKISDTSFLHNDSVTVTFEITNTGNVDGYEVPQLYIRDLYSSVTTPAKKLRNFKKVFIPAGQTEVVEMRLTADDFKLWNENLEHVIEDGDFEVQIGKNSADIILKSIIKILNN